MIARGLCYHGLLVVISHVRSGPTETGDFRILKAPGIKSVVETEHGPRVCLKVVKHRDNGKPPRVAYFGGIPLKRQRQAVLVDQQPQRYRSGCNELIKRLEADVCEMFNSTVGVEVHHIRTLRDLNVKGQREKPKWVQIMAARKRKTLVVCRTCHMDIHHGRSNPQSQR